MSEKVINKLANQHERVFETIKTASGLAKTAEEIKINWISEEFNGEFDALRKSKDLEHQYLVKFRDKLKNSSNKSYEKILMKQLDSLAMNIGKLRAKQESLKKFAPNLSSRLGALAKFKSRQKEVGRDFD